MFLLVAGAAPSGPRRVALVLGNGAYRSLTRLNNPGRDAAAVGQRLLELGFEVQVRKDVDLGEMDRQVDLFLEKAKGAEVALLYYAGHGVQVEHRNYLIPVDARVPRSEEELRRSSKELDGLVQRMQGAAKVSLVFLDACRDNPLLDAALPGTRDAFRDIRLTRVAKGTTLVLYSTSGGTRAQDGEQGKNSPFAQALLEHLGDRDPVQLMVTSVINEVRQRTLRAEEPQEPDYQGSLAQRVYLASPCPTGMHQEGGQCRPDVVVECPGGMRFEKGRGCVPVVVAAPVVKPPAPVVVAPAAAPAATVVAAPVASLEESKYRAKLVRIAPGEFSMGDATRHRVVLSQGYLLGETEVTQGQYRSVMGNNPSAVKGDDLPVEEVSWLDAVEYCNALSAKEGLPRCYEVRGDAVAWPEGVRCKGYRLPTEAEWEYAARAGQETVYAGSNDAGEVGWFSGNSGSTTHPVKRKKGNAWGLYDMTGNVLEWVWDLYGRHPAEGVTDPMGAETGQNRVVRSGSWFGVAVSARVAFRGDFDPGDRDVYLGFRVARSLPSSL